MSVSSNSDSSFSIEDMIVSSNSDSSDYESTEEIDYQIKSETIAQLIDICQTYINTKELKLKNVKDATLIYDFCEKFQKINIRKHCKSYLQTNLCVENVLEIYEEALELKQPELTKICWKYITENTSEILGHDSFISAKFETVFNIISSVFLAVNSELEVYNAVVKWGKENFKEKNLQIFRERIFPLLKEVRFVSMTYFEFSGSPCKDQLLTKEQQLEIFRIKSNPKVKRNEETIIERNWKNERRFEFLSSCYLSSECKNYLHKEKSHRNVLNIIGYFCSKVQYLKVWGVSIQINVKLRKNNTRLYTNVSLKLEIGCLVSKDKKYGQREALLRENKNFSETERITILLNEPVIVKKNVTFRISVRLLDIDTNITEFIYCTNYDVTYNELKMYDIDDDDDDYIDDMAHFAAIIATY